MVKTKKKNYYEKNENNNMDTKCSFVRYLNEL